MFLNVCSFWPKSVLLRMVVKSPAHLQCLPKLLSFIWNWSHKQRHELHEKFSPAICSIKRLKLNFHHWNIPKRLTPWHFRHLRSCSTKAMDFLWTASISDCSISSKSYSVLHWMHCHIGLKHPNNDLGPSESEPSKRAEQSARNVVKVLTVRQSRSWGTDHDTDPDRECGCTSCISPEMEGQKPSCSYLVALHIRSTFEFV